MAGRAAQLCIGQDVHLSPAGLIQHSLHVRLQSCTDPRRHYDCFHTALPFCRGVSFAEFS